MSHNLSLSSFPAADDLLASAAAPSSTADPANSQMTKKMIELSHHLQWEDTLFHSSSEFLDILRTLSNHDYAIYFRMIIRMTEIAQKTLRQHGVVLFLFAHCPENLQVERDIYFDILEEIYNQRQLLHDHGLTKRLARLTMPLRTTFSFTGLLDVPIPLPILPTGVRTRSYANLMPPPDAFSQPPRAVYSLPVSSAEQMHINDIPSQVDEDLNYSRPLRRNLGNLWSRQKAMY